MPEPKGFAIIVPNRKDISLKKKSIMLAELKEFPGSWKVKWLDKITRGALRLSSEVDDIRHFNVEMEYMQWRVLAKSAEKVPGNFDVWQHKNGYAVAVNCPKNLVDATAALLSLSVYGDLAGFSSKNLHKADFIAIQKYAFGLGGVMAALHLRNIKVGDSEMSVYNITGKNIGNPEKLIKAAKKVKRMGFRFPRLGDSEFHFWVADWGGGTLYQPSEFLPHQVIALAKFFEEALKN